MWGNKKKEAKDGHQKNEKRGQRAQKNRERENKLWHRELLSEMKITISMTAKSYATHSKKNIICNTSALKSKPRGKNPHDCSMIAFLPHWSIHTYRNQTWNWWLRRSDELLSYMWQGLIGVFLWSWSVYQGSATYQCGLKQAPRNLTLPTPQHSSLSSFSWWGNSTSNWNIYSEFVQ